MPSSTAVLDPAPSALADAALRLREAYRNGPIEPLRDVLEPGDAAGGYQIQRANTRFWQGEGRRIAGRKIGLTAEAVQRQFGVDQPDYGVLFADMRVEDGGRLASERLIQPKAEAEVAIVLGRDLDDPDATPEDMFRAADYAAAAIEIVDSRIRDWRITFADTVADNGSSAYFVLSSEKRKLEGLDLRTCGMALDINGKLASMGAGVACMGHPLIAASWLARTLARLGEPLKAGDVLLTGSLGPMAAIAAGDRVEATIGGLGRASFTLQG